MDIAGVLRGLWIARLKASRGRNNLRNSFQDWAKPGLPCFYTQMAVESGLDHKALYWHVRSIVVTSIVFRNSASLGAGT
jgi:hypothetical protein